MDEVPIEQDDVVIEALLSRAGALNNVIYNVLEDEQETADPRKVLDHG